jgi:ATP/maltotriose-dependent transcriptional regulator MalT
LLRLAVARLESGGHASPDLLVAAARRAHGALDAVLAERLAGAAVDAGGGAPALHALARAVARQGRFAEAETIFADLQRAATSDRELVVVAEARARNLLWGLGNVSQAERVVFEAERSVAKPDVLDEFAALRGWLVSFLGRPGDALAAVSPVLERGDARETLRLRAAVAAVHGMAWAGRLREAVELAEGCREAALRHADKRPLLAVSFESLLILGLSLSGRLREAAAIAEEGYETRLHMGTHEGAAVLAMGRGCVCLGSGRIRDAVRWLREGAELLRTFDPIGFGLPFSLAMLSQAAGQAGDVSGAEAALAEAETAFPEGTSLFEADLRRGRAWASAARGDLRQARCEASDAATYAEARGQLAFVVLALHDLARLGDAAGAASRLEALTRKVDGALVSACAAHATALAAGDARALETAAAALESTGALLSAAEASNAAARLYEATGHTASARTAGVRAALLARRCEGARTPGLVPPSPLDELTRREREISSLAATGLSNPAIASTLVLSVRTVENHLNRAYRKLGVTSRRELSMLLGGPPE